MAASGNFLGTLGSIAGGVIGLATGGIGGAISGWNNGGQLFGGGSSPNLPALPGGGGGGGGGLNLPFPVNGPGGVPLPGFGAPGAQPGQKVKGHWTKGTRKNPSHWTNRRRPRLNPMNVRAARRAVSRIKAGEKLFHRFLSVSHPGHTGRVKPKHTRKR